MFIPDADSAAPNGRAMALREAAEMGAPSPNGPHLVAAVLCGDDASSRSGTGGRPGDRSDRSIRPGAAVRRSDVVAWGDVRLVPERRGHWTTLARDRRRLARGNASRTLRERGGLFGRRSCGVMRR